MISLVGDSKIMMVKRREQTFLALWRDTEAAERAIPPTGDWCLLQMQHITPTTLCLLLAALMQRNVLQGYVVDPGLPGEQVVLVQTGEVR